jgi:hypothetical protein
MRELAVRVLSSTIAFALAASAVIGAVACSDDESSGDGNGGTPGTGGGSSVQPFNGDCTTAKWADVSDDCWSCMCAACADTLNACDEACVGVLECGMQTGCLVNQGDQILCEIRCVSSECLVDAGQGAAQAATAFDTCLISATKPSGFRACEDVCAIPYPGDVCTRYP